MLPAIKILLSLLTPILIGYFLLKILSAVGNFWARLCLSIGIGFGVSSYLFFLWLLIAGRESPAFMIVQIALAGVLGAAGWLISRKHLGSPDLKISKSQDSPWRLLKWAFFLVLAISMAGATLYFLVTPMGDWDAWDLWNMRALFLVKAKTHWRDFFAPEMIRSMDYPLMLSSAIAAAWSFVGRQSPWVPGLIALLFTFAAAGILITSIRAIRGPTQGWLAGILLLSNPFFIQHGASQYADVVLGFYMVAAVSIWSWQDFDNSNALSKVAISGILAGIAAWTKNEGMLFFLSMILGRILCKLRPGQWGGLTKELSVFLLAALPGLLALVYFKATIAPPNDLFAQQTGSDLWKKLTDYSRHAFVFQMWTNTLWTFGQWRFRFALVPAIYAILMGLSQHSKSLRRFPLAVLGLLSAGYYLTYILSPYELSWHVGASITRLFVQLWPLAVFSYFVSLNSPEEWQDRSQRIAGEKQSMAVPAVEKL